MSNQTFEKDGYIFVGELYWPTPPINIQRLRKETDVDLYASVKGDRATKYAFAQKNKFNKKIKKLVSLGAFLLNFYDDEIADIIIIVKLDNQVSGLLALKNGFVIPKAGDMIGSTEEIMGRAKHLINTHKIGNIWTAGHGQYFYSDRDILNSIKVHNPSFDPPPADYDLEGNELQSIWAYDNTKSAIKRSLLKPIPKIDYTNRKLVAASGIAITILLGSFAYYKTLNSDDDMPIARQAPVAPPTAMSATNFINICFSNTNDYFSFPGGWQLDDFSCTLNYRDSKFSGDYVLPDSLRAILVKKDVMFNNSDSKKGYQASLREPLKPIFIQVPATRQLTDRIKHIEELKADYGFQAQITMPPNFVSYATYNPILGQKITLSITSSFSPFWLLKKGALDGVNISQLTGKFDKSKGSFSWQLSGEFIK